MALTIYGSPRSRTLRVLWLAAELDLEYQHVPYEYDDPALKSDKFLALNPCGAIPTIVDDGHRLFESLAINLYLAKKYSADRPDTLYATDLEEESALWQWSLWAHGHVEPWVQKDRSLADLVTAVGAHAEPLIEQALATLERTLGSADWLVGARFTVADLNVAAVLSPSRSSTLDLKPFPRVADWLARCYARPKAIEVRRRFAP